MTTAAPDADTDRMVPVAEAAVMLGATPATLRSWRHREQGPASYRIGGLVCYQRSELLAWIAEQKTATRKGGN